MNIRLFATALAAALSTGLAVPAHAASADGGDAKLSTRTISLGMFPALRPLALVRAEHWLEDAGYHVEWHEFIQGIPPEAAAMAAGSIDLGEADTSGIEQVAARSPGVMWYIANGASNYVALVATKQSGIKSVKDLKGRKVAGVSPNTAPTAVLQMALQKAGLTLKDIQGFSTAGPTEPAALERGAFDAAISYVPYTSETITAGTSVLITTASDVYGKTWPGGGIVVRPQFAKEHPDVVVDLLRYVARAEKLLKDKPDEAYKALAKGADTSLKNVTYSYQHKLVEPADIFPDKAALKEQAGVLQKYGAIKVPDVSAFIDELVHPEFAAKVDGK
jgi:ABC-type nitrate/sulfonate/bicarbonate transport system substrate-binding protein